MTTKNEASKPEALTWLELDAVVGGGLVDGIAAVAGVVAGAAAYATGSGLSGAISAGQKAAAATGEMLGAMAIE